MYIRASSSVAILVNLVLAIGLGLAVRAQMNPLLPNVTLQLFPAHSQASDPCIKARAF